MEVSTASPVARSGRFAPTGGIVPEKLAISPRPHIQLVGDVGGVELSRTPDGDRMLPL
jgi:hypothetical protein